ncbi:MAG TPA: hypothetical protein HPP87_02405 [Planctomycetes bacterium]|nr:hypothetical protein [Planctomycetota bacterium]HIJ70199.1 hypothetical protein [Planctomycetota bacterium]
MQKKQLTQLVLLLTTIVWNPAGGGDWTEFAVDFSTNDQQNPDIHGNTIVWQQLVAGDWDIYGADIDVNGDCQVDLTDFAVLASNWLAFNLEPEEFCGQ